MSTTLLNNSRTKYETLRIQSQINSQNEKYENLRQSLRYSQLQNKYPSQASIYLEKDLYKSDQFVKDEFQSIEQYQSSERKNVQKIKNQYIIERKTSECRRKDIQYRLQLLDKKLFFQQPKLKKNATSSYFTDSKQSWKQYRTEKQRQDKIVQKTDLSEGELEQQQQDDNQQEPIIQNNQDKDTDADQNMEKQKNELQEELEKDQDEKLKLYQVHKKEQDFYIIQLEKQNDKLKTDQQKESSRYSQLKKDFEQFKQQFSGQSQLAHYSQNYDSQKQKYEELISKLKTLYENESKKNAKLLDQCEQYQKSFENQNTHVDDALKSLKQNYESRIREQLRLLDESKQKVAELSQNNQNNQSQVKSEYSQNVSIKKDQIIEELIKNNELKDQEINKMEELIENFKQLLKHMQEEKGLLDEENQKMGEEVNSMKSIFQQIASGMGINPELENNNDLDQID